MNYFIIKKKYNHIYSLNKTIFFLFQVIDSAFSNFEALSALMNEFFSLFPGTRSAYSVASALGGGHNFQQHSGITIITPTCKWIPLFQGLFNCHHPVKVNFDLQSTIDRKVFFVYNSDTGEQLNHAYNLPLTYNFKPNNQGYAVIGHGSLNKVSGVYSEVQWQLSLLSSSANDFHVCDSIDPTYCIEQPLQPSNKMHIDEVFIPNRRNILGGIQLTALRFDYVSFRAALSNPEVSKN